MRKFKEDTLLRGDPEKRRNNKTPHLRFSAYVLFLLFILIPPAHAEDADEITFCHLLADYQQPAGVEYKAGVDVHGKPVVPADGKKAKPLRNFDSVEIPVVADLIKKFDPSVPWGTELKPYVALISIHNGGKVEYNGQDISQQAQDLCNEEKNEQAGPAKP